MIRWLLHRFLLGWSVIFHNFKLAFAILMLVAAPFTLIWAVSSIFYVASSNIYSIEVDEVSNLHESVEFVLSNSKLEGVQLSNLPKLVNENNRLTSLRIISSTKVGAYEIETSYPDDNQYVEQFSNLLRLSIGSSGETVIFPFVKNNEREWQAVRHIDVNDKSFFIATTHNFSQIDDLLASRTSNLLLFFIVVIITLSLMVYWVYRQTNLEPEVEKLRHKIDENDLFSSNMVHELRSPLTAIKGYASLISESVERESELASFSNQIANSATRMIDLVNDFLNATKIQSGKEQMDITELSINVLITDIVNELKPLAESKSLHLLVEKESAKPHLESSEKHLRQVFTNLISNSIKYTKEGGVKISIENSKNQCTIRIKDTGVGMSAVDQQKIFTPFVRVGEASTAHHSTGTGLGMWITKKILERLHGEVGVESISGVGTHIVVKIPTSY